MLYGLAQFRACKKIRPPYKQRGAGKEKQIMGDNRRQYFLTYEGKMEVLVEEEHVLAALHEQARRCPSDDAWFLIAKQKAIVARLQYQTAHMRETLQMLIDLDDAEGIPQGFPDDIPF